LTVLWAKRFWDWGRGLVLAAAILCYLAALLVHNTFGLYREAPHKQLDHEAEKLLSATGTTQQWNMFAPNVGTVSYSPIVVLVMRDGSRVALHSIVEPELPNWDQDYPIPNEIDADSGQRLYAWRFHAGDGRIRKYESRAASTEFGWWKVRTDYARWKAEQWISEDPSRRPKLKRIELWRAKLRHTGYGRRLHCESTEILNIYPQSNPALWPIPIDYTYPFYRL